MVQAWVRLTYEYDLHCWSYVRDHEVVVVTRTILQKSTTAKDSSDYKKSGKICMTREWETCDVACENAAFPIVSPDNDALVLPRPLPPLDQTFTYPLIFINIKYTENKIRKIQNNKQSKYGKNGTKKWKGK